MENEFRTLSQQDIDALIKGKAQQEPPDPGPAMPTEPEGPLPKVINLTGMDVSQAIPNAPSAPPLPDPTSPPFHPTPSATDTGSANPQFAQIEQSVAETNASVQQIRQELQALTRQYQSLTQSLEKISRGLKDTPSYRVRETFTCGNCKSQNNVAMPVKCTQCGRINWWGWWPDPKKED